MRATLPTLLLSVFLSISISHQAEAKKSKKSQPTETIAQKKARLNTEIGNNFAKNKQYPRATAKYVKALKADPKYAPARYFLGRTLIERGFEKKGMKQVATAVAVDPKFTKARNFLIKHFYKKKFYQKALKHSKIATRDFSYNNPEESWVLRARTESKLKMNKAALQSAKKAAATNPVSCTNRRNLAKVFLNLNAPIRTLEISKQAKRLCRSNPKKLESLAYMDAVALYKMKRYSESKRLLLGLGNPLSAKMKVFKPKLLSKLNQKTRRR